MANCPVCQRDTSPVKIGGQLYCSVCGTMQPSSDAPAPRRLSLDLSPRTRTNASHAGAPARPATSPAPTPAPAAAPVATSAARHGTAAGSLHQRTKTSRVLDLRDAEPKKVVAPQPVHTTPAAPPQTTRLERQAALVTERLARAKQIERSPHIGKFSGQRLPAPDPVTHHQSVNEHLHHPQPAPSQPVAAATTPRTHVPAPSNTDPIPHEQHLPAHAATHHAAMARLAPTPPSVTAGETAPPPMHAAVAGTNRLGFSSTAARNRTLATVTAVALMGGYIWLQNYPKLALQSASSKAGIQASLPGYLPSSYNLKNTNTSPGLVTLSFFSPSTTEPLTIQQARTDWDSSSLLDNYVAHRTDDYATVQSQGLTIYLFNNNQAAWVNHGIQYGITGAGHLSREQILKIAYSL